MVGGAVAVGRKVGRGVALTVGRGVWRGVDLAVGRGVRGVDVRSGAGVPGTISARPAPESPERRIGW